jgi:hypothetical protein
MAVWFTVACTGKADTTPTDASSTATDAVLSIGGASWWMLRREDGEP